MALVFISDNKFKPSQDFLIEQRKWKIYAAYSRKIEDFKTITWQKKAELKRKKAEELGL